MNFSRVNNHNGNKGGLWIALIFLFTLSLNAQNNYPLNDPRNPQCPCHKYQKLAEEEFKNLLNKTNKVNNEPLLALNKAKVISNDDQEKTKHDHNPINVQFLNNDKDNTLGNLPHDFGLINEQIHNGISSDELERINLSQGDNVLGIINDEPEDIIVSEQKMNRSGSFYKAKRSSTTKHWKGKHKKHSAHYKQLKRIFCVSGWDIWKRKRVTSACYHWK